MSIRIIVAVTFALIGLSAYGGEYRGGNVPNLDRFIVTVPGGDPAPEPLGRELASLYGGVLRDTYSELPMYVIEMPEAAARRMAADSRVLYVEQDSRVVLSTAGSQPVDNSATVPSLWGLDRIDEYSPIVAGMPGAGTYYDGTYEYCTSGSAAVVYVIDSGIQARHAEFKTGQVKAGYKIASTSSGNYGTASDPCWTTSTSGVAMDTINAGHGTAVASIIAGKTYGVAKDATLVPVKVMDCVMGDAYVSQVISGIDWTINDIRLKTDASIPDSSKQNSVVNMSFEFEKTTALNGTCYGGIPCVESSDFSLENNLSALDDAVSRLAAMPRTTVVAAAGNKNRDVGPRGAADPADTGVSPARVPGVLAVGASTRSDQRAGFSNYGSRLTVFAPGERIESAHIAPNKPKRSQAASCVNAQVSTGDCTSGTSFAAPYVAGVVARLLDIYPGENGASMKSRIQNTATSAMVDTTIGAGSPDLLLYKAEGRCTRPVYYP